MLSLGTIGLRKKRIAIEKTRFHPEFTNDFDTSHPRSDTTEAFVGLLILFYLEYKQSRHFC